MDNIKPILNVYLAGRIDGLTAESAKGWRVEAIEKLAKAGMAGICPIIHGKELDSSPYEHFEAGRFTEIFKTDIELIRRSDALLVNMDTISFGTAQEIFYADQILNIPVVAYNNISTKSAFYYATVYKTCETMQDAVDELSKINSLLKKGELSEYESPSFLSEMGKESKPLRYRIPSFKLKIKN